MKSPSSKIEIKNVVISAVKADLVKGAINLTIAFSLNDENLALKDDFSFAAFNNTPFNLTLDEIQTKMDNLLAEAKRK